MVQVDVFWSYGLGAGFATAAARQLRVRREEQENSGFKDLLENRHMVRNILYAALLFAPSGVYLVWGFPEWETMQAGTRDMPAWLITMFAITNVSQAILGFWVTGRLITSGRQYLGLLQAWAGYFGMFFILVNGWDKTGWHRFFSEDRADFAAWDSQPAIDQVIDWLTSGVALTLYGLGVVLIPVMAAIMIGSVRSGYRIGGDYAPDRSPAGVAKMVAVTAAILLSGVPAAVLAHLLITSIGWIPGAIAAAALIHLLLLWPRTGLLHRGYAMLALEDGAYERLRASRPSGPGGTPRAVAAEAS